MQFIGMLILELCSDIESAIVVLRFLAALATAVGSVALAAHRVRRFWVARRARRSPASRDRSDMRPY
jgi:hypothetical protein